jgi:hypothetical protein
MPSNAFRKFERNMLVDVDRIIETHGNLNHDGRGKRGLGHITRGGVLMLCAAWELYIEEVILEGVQFFFASVDLPNALPRDVQKELARAVKESKHDLKPLELAGEGWKNLYRNHTNETLAGLNTPKSGNLDPLFKRFLGANSISGNWSSGAQAINAFVGVRGDIAHRGRDARYVTIGKLSGYKGLVSLAAIETDNYLSEFLRDNTPGVARPWNRRQV